MNLKYYVDFQSTWFRIGQLYIMSGLMARCIGRCRNYRVHDWFVIFIDKIRNYAVLTMQHVEQADTSWALTVLGYLGGLVFGIIG